MDKETWIKIVKEIWHYVPPMIWSMIAAFVRVFYFVNKISVRRTIGIVLVSIWSGMMMFQYVKNHTEGNMVGVYVSLAALCGEWVFSYLVDNHKEIISRIFDVFIKKNDN